MENPPPTKTVGVLVTLDAIYQDVKDIKAAVDSQLDNMYKRVNALENKVTALYVTNGIALAAIIGIITDWIKR